MDLKTQIEIWNSVDDYGSIIEAIEELPEDELTPELIGELGFAYSRAAEGEDRDLHIAGLTLLSAVEEHLGDTRDWNYRMGYTLYWLAREGDALAYFRRALEIAPGDLESSRFATQCEERISYPRFDDPFSERVYLTWQEFEEGEAELRSMIQAEMAGMTVVSEEGEGEGVAKKCDELLSIAFSDSSFELGYDGKKYELTLTAENGPAELFKLCYFKDRAPASVLKNWNIVIGRQPEPEFTAGFDDVEITADDITAWVEWNDDGVQISLYSADVLPLMDMDAEDQVWWIMSALLDHTFGEVCAMAILDSLEILHDPLDTKGVPLSSVPTVLEKAGFDMSNDPARLTEITLLYETEEPETDEDADWRLDIIKGETVAPTIIDGYFGGDDAIMNSYHNDGAVPAFIAWPIEALEGKNKEAALEKFCDSLESKILKTAGSSAVKFIGKAAGLYAGYLDFIAWNLDAVLDAARDALDELGVPEATFHTLRREGDSVGLIEEGE